METIYKNHTIEWGDLAGIFSIKKDGIELKRGFRRVSECEEWIDKQLKKKFKRVPVLHVFGFGSKHVDRVEGNATSIVDVDYVWVTSKGNRGKVQMKRVWVDNPENREALKIVLEKEKQIESLKDEVREISDKTIRLTAEMMIAD
jgi:hypothetical protein